VNLKMISNHEFEDEMALNLFDSFKDTLFEGLAYCTIPLAFLL